MSEVEITAVPPVTPTQLSVMNCHALLNVYGVIHDELLLLRSRFPQQPALCAASLAECEARIRRLNERRAAQEDTTRVQQFKATIQAELQDGDVATDATATASRARLDSLFWILQVRAQELLARAAAPTHPTQYTAAELEADFHEFFRVMAEQSRGRYDFAYNLARQKPTDYYVDLRFESARGGAITIPSVFKDVMRDLVANARKYTPPGGQIRAALFASQDGLRFIVEDTGCGIPADELSSVAHYGWRARNVRGIRTLGAGCGLTKAFLVTRQLGGRFWIASQEARGTRVQIRLPPVSLPGPAAS